MIVGLGTDIVEISRIQNTLTKFNSRFKNRCFTKKEITESEKNPHPFKSYAKRFAAKEAFAKALGTGISNGIYWKDIGIENNKYNKPFILLTGNTLRKFLELSNDKFFIELSLSDEKSYAIANVIIFKKI